MFNRSFILPEKKGDWAYGVALIKSRKSPDKSVMQYNKIEWTEFTVE